MLERVLDTWLSKANERSFQVPFCHSLASEGETVVHMSRHCGMELGKDILTIAKDGVPCAYQLKGIGGGKLTLGRWRDEVQKQAHDLVLGRIVHPSIPATSFHRSYLVINGELDEEVARSIDDFNAARKSQGQPRLRLNTIVKGEMLRRFQALQTNLWPVELANTKTFLEMFLETGKGCLPRGKLSSLFESLLPLRRSRDKGGTTQCERAIASSAILCSAAIGAFTNADNHVAEVEAWTMFSAYVLYVAETWSLPKPTWNWAIEVAKEAIFSALGRLCDEVMVRKHFQEGPSLAEMTYQTLLSRIRLTHVLGLMGIYATWRRQRREDGPHDAFLREFCVTNLDKTMPLWGEYAAPQCLACYFYCRTIDATDGPDRFLSSLITRITQANGPNAGELPNPYYSPEDWLPHLVELANEPLDDSFSLASYTLEAVVHLYVRRNWKQEMKAHWPAISRLAMRSFKPKPTKASYLWRCEGGTHQDFLPTPTTRWADLKAAAAESRGLDVPRLIREHPLLYLCFLCVYPHRLTASGVRWVSTELEKDAQP